MTGLLALQVYNPQRLFHERHGMDAQRTSNPRPEREPTWVGLLRDLSRCGRLAYRVLATELDSLLSPSQAVLLWTCREMEVHDASQLELAQRMGVSPAQVSGLVEELRHRDLLVSERSPQDRRRQTWRLTDAGQQAARSLDTHLEAWSAACRSEFGGAALDELSQDIQSLEAFVERLPEVARVQPTKVDEHRRRAAA